MEFTDYIRILRKHWLSIVALALVGVGMGAAVSLVQRPVYEATTQVFVSTQGGDTTSELVQGNNFTLQRVLTYASLASTQSVLAPVIQDLGLDSTVSELASRVSAAPLTNTTIVEVTVLDRDPLAAAEIANATAASLTNQVGALESSREGQDAVSPVRLEIVQPADVPTFPVSPKVGVNITIGLLVGLLLGVGLAFLREILDTRIRSEQHVGDVTPVPVVGALALDPKAKSRPLIVHSDPLNPRAEAYRALRTNLQFVEVDGTSRSFVVTSSMPSEGKSTTTANLALALADAGQTVILIDADLRKPKVAEYLGIEGSVGLTDVLIGRAKLVDAVQQWGSGGLYALPAGRVPPNPSELLGSKAMRHLIDELESEFDWVIFDAPPLLPVTDAAILSKSLTGALVVVASGRTKKHQLSHAISVLRTVGAPVAGVVMTMMPTKGADAYGGYGLYGYGGDYRQFGKQPRGGMLAGLRRAQSK